MRSNEVTTMWSIIRILAVTLCVFAFTPWVVSPEVYTPMVLGLPYSLGAGILVSVALIGLVVLGAIFAPSVSNGKE